MTRSCCKELKETNSLSYLQPFADHLFFFLFFSFFFSFFFLFFSFFVSLFWFLFFYLHHLHFFSIFFFLYIFSLFFFYIFFLSFIFILANIREISTVNRLVKESLPNGAILLEPLKHQDKPVYYPLLWSL